MKTSLIVAVAEDNVIGKKGEMPWSIPLDLKFFQQTTYGKTVIMGRKTFESLKLCPLKNRRNIVITSKIYHKPSNIEICSSLIDALSLCDNEDEVFIIGGSKLYKEAIKIADRLYITHIPLKIDNADTFFPEITNEWKWIYGIKKKDHKNHFILNFSIYEK